jgi:hypothetical protein
MNSQPNLIGYPGGYPPYDPRGPGGSGFPGGNFPGGNPPNPPGRGSTQSFFSGGSGFPIPQPPMDPRQPQSGAEGMVAGFIRQLNYAISMFKDHLTHQGVTYNTLDTIVAALNRMGISLEELSPDKYITDEIMNLWIGRRRNQAELAKALKYARSVNIFPFVYLPKYMHRSDQKLRNVTYLNDTGKPLSDITSVVPGQGNYQLKRKGNEYEVLLGSSKRTFASQQDATYFIQTGGFGRKSYGPISGKLFGTPIKNISQAIF